MKVDFSKQYQPKIKQAQAHSCRAKYLLFGGAMGGGKSWFLCAEAIKNAMMFEGNRLVIVRKELSVLRRTILVSFLSMCPREIIKNFNQSSLVITFINGSVLTFIEADKSKDPLLNKLKGLEIGWFGIDEANEVSVEVYRILKTRLRWVLPNKKKPRYEGRLTSNPEQSWLINTFIHSQNNDEVYIQSLTSDNYDEGSEYYQNLMEAFKDNPQMMQKYLYGDWTSVDKINQLIPSENIRACNGILRDGSGTALGIYPSRYGDDRTVFVVLVDGNIERIDTYQNTSTVEVAYKAIELVEKYNISCENVGVDDVGIGAGVIDSLKEKGYEIEELTGGAKPEETDEPQAFRAFNLRAQMYYQLRKDIINRNIGNLNNQELMQELSAIQYEISSEKTVKIIDKGAIKKILGFSPDIADALCYANWVKNKKKKSNIFIMFSGGD